MQYPKNKSFVFPQPQYFLKIILNFGNFSARVLIKKGSYKKVSYTKEKECKRQLPQQPQKLARFVATNGLPVAWVANCSPNY